MGEQKSNEDNRAARLAHMTKKIRDSLLTLQKYKTVAGGF